MLPRATRNQIKGGRGLVWYLGEKLLRPHSGLYLVGAMNSSRVVNWLVCSFVASTYLYFSRT